MLFSLELLLWLFGLIALFCVFALLKSAMLWQNLGDLLPAGHLIDVVFALSVTASKISIKKKCHDSLTVDW